MSKNYSSLASIPFIISSYFRPTFKLFQGNFRPIPQALNQRKLRKAQRQGRIK